MLASSGFNEKMLETFMIYAIPIIAIVGAFAWLIVRTTSTNGLKRPMIDRGMSPDEIEQVLSTRSRH